MDISLLALAFSAVLISFIHTLSGPDHYLPFIVLSRSRKWKVSKTVFLTVVCGLGHVLSSVILGLIGVFLGWQLNKITWFQDIRGNVSSWALLLFGLIYLGYGIWKAYLYKPHKHFDIEGEEVFVHTHAHSHTHDHHHPHTHEKKIKVTPMVLFAIFVMGPSEPLIPLLFYSGVNRSVIEISVLITVFTISTVFTMLGMVLLGCYGYSLFKTDKLERYVHAIGGGVMLMCGVGMVFLGW